MIFICIILYSNILFNLNLIELIIIFVYLFLQKIGAVFNCKFKNV